MEAEGEAALVLSVAFALHLVLAKTVPDESEANNEWQNFDPQHEYF
jgi:hypothetical protein